LLLLVKNLLFTILVPGSLGAFVPVFLLRHSPARWGMAAVPACLAVGVGSAIYLWCLWDFATQGQGTPAPIDPPKRLVTRGLYRYVRNPMYVGVLTAILGWALLFRSTTIILYAAGVFMSVHLFVLLYEEPHLRKIFGVSYAQYCSQVGRWLPW
jgi:protein-S-isoprenylcysteine O-methyltransferase Ste14